MGDMAGTKAIGPTPGATVTITINPTVTHHIATWTAGQAESVVISGSPQDGQRLTCFIINDATSRTITFSTGFSASTTLVGTVSKRAAICFLASGGKFYEVSRATGLTP
jgi:hypothetical protein